MFFEEKIYLEKSINLEKAAQEGKKPHLSNVKNGVWILSTNARAGQTRLSICNTSVLETETGVPRIKWIAILNRSGSSGVKSSCLNTRGTNPQKRQLVSAG